MQSHRHCHTHVQGHVPPGEPMNPRAGQLPARVVGRAGEGRGEREVAMPPRGGGGGKVRRRAEELGVQEILRFGLGRGAGAGEGAVGGRSADAPKGACGWPQGKGGGR